MTGSAKQYIAILPWLAARGHLAPMVEKFGVTPSEMIAALYHEVEAHQATQAALRGFMADLDRAEADKAAAVEAERKRVIALLRARSDEAMAASIASGGNGQYMVAAAEGMLSSVLMQMVAAIRNGGAA